MIRSLRSSLAFIFLSVMQLQGQALTAVERGTATAVELQQFVAGPIGALSRSTLTEGNTWKLFGIGTDPTTMNDEEIRRSRQDPLYARRRLNEELDAAKSDPGLQKEVEQILGKNYLSPAPRISLPASFPSHHWNYHYLSVNSPLAPPLEKSFSSMWLLVEYTDPTYNVALIHAPNVILIPHSTGMLNHNLSRFRTVHESFIDDFDYGRNLSLVRPKGLEPDELPPNQMLPGFVIYTSARNRDKSEILTRFVFTPSKQLVGEARLVSSDPKKQKLILATELSQYPKGTRVLFYGDDLHSINLNEVADHSGVEAFRRSPSVRKPLLDTQLRLKQIASRSLEDQSTVFVNGLPKTIDAVRSYGPLTGSPEAWFAARDKVETATKHVFANRISDKKAFLNELLTGENDLVVLVAHSDGIYLYLGGERISWSDLASASRPRRGSSRPRVAILAVCNAGQISGPARSGFPALFRPQLQSWAEVLVRQGFFDEVIAPDHPIDADEAVAVLSKLPNIELAEIRNLFANWNRSVMLTRPTLSPEVLSSNP